MLLVLCSNRPLPVAVTVNNDGLMKGDASGLASARFLAAAACLPPNGCQASDRLVNANTTYKKISRVFDDVKHDELPRL